MIRVACRRREACDRQRAHAENREQAHQPTDADQVIGVSHDLLFQIGIHARSGVIGLFVNRYEFGRTI